MEFNCYPICDDCYFYWDDGTNCLPKFLTFRGYGVCSKRKEKVLASDKCIDFECIICRHEYNKFLDMWR